MSRTWKMFTGFAWVDWPAGDLPHAQTLQKASFWNQFRAWTKFLSDFRRGITLTNQYNTTYPGDVIQSRDFYNSKIRPVELFADYFPFQNYIDGQIDTEIGSICALRAIVARPADIAIGASLQSAVFRQWVLDVRTYLDRAQWLPVYPSYPSGVHFLQKEWRTTGYENEGDAANGKLSWGAFKTAFVSRCTNTYAKASCAFIGGTAGSWFPSFAALALVDLPSDATKHESPPFYNPGENQAQICATTAELSPGVPWTPFSAPYGLAAEPIYLEAIAAERITSSRFVLLVNTGDELPEACKPSGGFVWE